MAAPLHQATAGSRLIHDSAREATAAGRLPEGAAEAVELQLAWRLMAWRVEMRSTDSVHAG